MLGNNHFKRLHTPYNHFVNNCEVMKRSTYDIKEATEVISNMSSLKRGIQCVVIHLLRISNQNPQMIISGPSTNFSITSWKYGPTARL